MNRRLFLLECSAPHWIEVVSRLAQQDVEVVYWSAWKKMMDDVRLAFPSCIFHDTMNAKLALGPSGEDCLAGPFDEACEIVWRNDAQVVYDMMNRFDHSRDLSFVERSTLFYTYLVYWRAVIKRHSPDLVVFAAPPHVVYDYIVLSLCRALKIQTLMFEEIPIAPPYSLFMKDYRSGVAGFQLAQIAEERESCEESLKLLSRLQGSYGEAAPSREIVARADMVAALAEGRQGLVDRVEVVAKIDQVHEGKYEANEKIVNVSSLYKEKGKSLRASFSGDYANTRYMKQLLEDRSITEELDNFYHARSIDASVLDGRSFVYFPLAGQPERTSNPQADIYTNQLLVANLLSHGTPPNWAIAAKEHPNQFHPNFAVNMCRSTDYYAALLKVPRVSLISSLSDPFGIIDKAAFIATTGGTAAIEAVARGKPVLLFGDAWYRDCPGIFRMRNLKDVLAMVKRFEAGEVLVHPDDFLSYMESIKRIAFKGIADYPPADFEVNNEQNVCNLVEIITRELA